MTLIMTMVMVTITVIIVAPHCGGVGCRRTQFLPRLRESVLVTRVQHKHQRMGLHARKKREGMSGEARGCDKVQRWKEPIGTPGFER